jgi:hypothetical protein
MLKKGCFPGVWFEVGIISGKDYVGVTNEKDEK